MRKPNVAKLQAQVDAWNAAHPVGAVVEVTKDNGNVLHTLTRTKAWVLSGHTAVVMVNGISGRYLLDRVRAYQGLGNRASGRVRT